jgi:hypothetical protein
MYTITAYGSNGTQYQTLTVSAQQNPVNRYACQDGVDNDGDGLVDFPADPGCTSYYDNDEYNYTNNYNNYAPVVTTNAATNIADTSATLNGYIGSQGSSWTYPTYYFQYGTTPSSLGYQTNSQTAGSYAGNVAAYVNGLMPNTTYYFRVVGTNGYGTAYGSTLSFVTTGGSSNAYGATTTLATSISAYSARLNGFVTASTVTPIQAYFESMIGTFKEGIIERIKSRIEALAMEPKNDKMSYRIQFLQSLLAKLGIAFQIL